MTTERSIDERISTWLLETAPEQLPDRVLTATFERTRVGRQRRSLTGWRPFATRRTTSAALAVGAAAIVLIAVGVIFPQGTNPHVVGGASHTPSTSATSPTTSPTLAPTLAPTPTIALLTWTHASLAEDWPAPVRSEPVGGAIVRPQTGPHGSATYPDPGGDTGSTAYPWVDIQGLFGTYTLVIVDLASNLPPLLPPTEQWIAYGVVVDDDRDGIPDRRFGIDNIPTTAPGAREHRTWITDLHTGLTVAAVGPPYGKVGDIYWDTFFPGERAGIGARLGFGGDIAGGGTRGLRSPFYAWASVIVGGRVVATDYAPDEGWLDPSKAK
jgi:hypothetical protein